MTERLVIVDAAPADDALEQAWQSLEQFGELTVYPRSTPKEALERVQRATAIFSNKVAISEQLLAAAPELRYVGILATGIDHVDRAACRARNVAVANVPGYSGAGVAQWVFAALLEVWNGIADHSRAVADGAWERSPDFSFFTQPIIELQGRTLVILGAGDIGARVTRIAEAFGMQVIAAQVPGRAPSADRMPLAEALAQADVVSLHCPLTEQTARMVNAEFLAACKPGAVLINSGRGALLDDAAVVAALDSGHLSAACLDVLAPEPPPPGHVLVAHPKALVTPHIAWGSTDSRKRLIAEAAANFAAFQAGERRNRVD